MKIDLNDISIVPAITSNIQSRGDVDPFYDNGNLPIFVAPMDTVIGRKNFQMFLHHKLNVCIPRGEGFDMSKDDDIFISLSLNEFNNRFLLNEEDPDGVYYVLIDMANGHMKDLLDAVNEAKMKYSNLTLMVGNVANPETYKLLSEAGADYIRVSIGSGNACLTSEQTAIHYPMASLIKECYEISCTLYNPAKIVADGGMKSFSDIIKALALGADYVMLGSLLNKSIQSIGKNYLYNILPISYNRGLKLFHKGYPIYKSFRGMSSKSVQKKWGNKILKTSEGIETRRKVEYSLHQWVGNFEDYLRSAMSYTGSKTLDEFKESETIIISNNAFKRFHK